MTLRACTVCTPGSNALTATAQRLCRRIHLTLIKNAQRAHANIAIASCNVVGKMPGNSVERDFLSQAFSDFIYAIIIEEMGLWGAVLVVFLYIVLLFRAGRIASRCERSFPAFLAIGACAPAGVAGHAQYARGGGHSARNGPDAAAHQPRRYVHRNQQRVHRHDTEREPLCAAHAGAYQHVALTRGSAPYRRAASGHRAGAGFRFRNR